MLFAHSWRRGFQACGSSGLGRQRPQRSGSWCGYCGSRQGPERLGAQCCRVLLFWCWRRQELATRLHLCRVCKVVLLDLLVLRVWTLRPSVLIVPFSVCAVYPAAFGAGSHGGLASWPSRSGLGSDAHRAKFAALALWSCLRRTSDFKGQRHRRKRRPVASRDEGLIWEKLVDLNAGFGHPAPIVRLQRARTPWSCLAMSPQKTLTRPVMQCTESHGPMPNVEFKWKAASASEIWLLHCEKHSICKMNCIGECNCCWGGFRSRACAGSLTRLFQASRSARHDGAKRHSEVFSLITR